MKAIRCNSYHGFKTKQILTSAILVCAAVAGVLAPVTASASLVTGNASITIDNPAFIAANAWGNYVETHWGANENTLAIDASTTGGTNLSIGGSNVMSFSVNTNTTTMSYPAAGAGGRTTQATTMDASNTAAGQIGLSGALRVNGPGGLLTPYDFRLMKTSGIWNISTFDTSFSFNDFLTLSSVNESVNGNGELLLSGDLQVTGLWAMMLGADTTAVVGTFNLTPSAVPVPAAVWLFASGLLGLVATKRKKI